MKQFILVILTVLLCCSSLFIPTFAQSSSGVKEGHVNEDKWLTLSENKTGARYIVDSKGNPVQLFGMARCQHHADDEDAIYAGEEPNVDSLVKHYADYGANFMRLAIDMPELCGGDKKTSQQINDFITRKIDPDVQAIIRNGMYVMLDIHMYPPSTCETVEGIVQYARDYYLPVTVELAKKYKDEPMVAVIEPWNEPYPADQKQLSVDKAEWTRAVREYYIYAVKEIRKVDKRHIILVSDWNAGWGCATPETWNGYYNKVDPNYNNVAYSVHCTDDQLEAGYNFYSNWWKSLADDNNLCLIFGEIETEYDISTEKGMKNLCNYLDETKDKYHFSGMMWRPHGQKWEYHNVWADTGWIKNYCSPSPIGGSRYVSEAEDTLGQKFDQVKTTTSDIFFGTKANGSGISLKANAPNDFFHETTSEIDNDIVYNSGKYKLVVRAAGQKNYSADFIVGYRDVDGVVHQIARFAGKNSNSEVYYQNVEFTASKKIVSFVFFGCDKKVNSVFIDRVYLTASKSYGVEDRSFADVEDVNKIIYLDGKQEKVEEEFEESEEPEDYEVNDDDKSENSESNGNKNNKNNKDKDNKKESSKNKDKNKTNVNIQYVDGDDAEITDEDLDFGDTKKKNKGFFTPTIIIILASIVLVWIGLLVGVIIYKRKKKTAQE